MAVLEHIRGLLNELELKFYESAGKNERTTSFLTVFTLEKKKDVKVEIYFDVSADSENIKIYCKDFINISDFNWDKLASLLLDINPRLIYGGIGIRRKLNSLQYCIGHSLYRLSEKDDIPITKAQLQDYMAYILFVVERLIEEVDIKARDEHEGGN
jgi:hypothetical protein